LAFGNKFRLREQDLIAAQRARVALFGKPLGLESFGLKSAARGPRYGLTHLPNRAMTPERSEATDDEHRVVPFRRPGAAPTGSRWRWPPSQPASPPVEGLEKYERGDEEDDYRHRMLVNLAAFLVTVALAVAGAWLAIKLAEMRKNQDCVLSGRRNCTPIDVKPMER
jgi:hypothetical protein